MSYFRRQLYNYAVGCNKPVCFNYAIEFMAKLMGFYLLSPLFFFGLLLSTSIISSPDPVSNFPLLWNNPSLWLLQNNIDSVWELSCFLFSIYLFLYDWVDQQRQYLVLILYCAFRKSCEKPVVQIPNSLSIFNWVIRQKFFQSMICWTLETK